MTLEFIDSKTHPDNIFFIVANGIKDCVDLGALLSRYSRSDKGAKQIYKEEFLTNPNRGPEFYKKVFAGYGDESIAELANTGFAVCIENVPILWSTFLLHYRELSAIEKSTRYVKALDYYRWEGAPDYYINRCDKLMDKYNKHYEHSYNKLSQKYVSNLDVEIDKPTSNALRAKSLDHCRHMLPLSTLTSLGIVANLRSWLNILSKEAAIATRIEHMRLYEENLLWPLTELFKEHFPTIFTKFDDLYNTANTLTYSRGFVEPIKGFGIIDCASKTSLNIVGKTVLGWGRAKKHKTWREAELVDFTINIPDVDIATCRDIQRHRHFTVISNNLNMKSTKEVDVLSRSMGVTMNVILKGNLRQWIHVIELRTQSQGHYKYREIFQKCAILIANEFCLPVKEIFPFADMRTDSEIGLGRLTAEKKNEEKQNV